MDMAFCLGKELPEIEQCLDAVIQQNKAGDLFLISANFLGCQKLLSA